MYRRTKKTITEKISSKLSSYSRYLFLLIVFLLATSLIRNVINTIKVRRRINEEAQKIENLEKEMQELEIKVQKTESEEHIEIQLRDKLGLAKEGEIVLILPDDETLKKIAPVIETEEEDVLEPVWRRWLKLFL